MAYDPSLLGKTSEDFRFIFTDREAIGKNKHKIRIRSHLGPVPQVSGRLCEAKPEAKSPSDFIPSKEYNFCHSVKKIGSFRQKIILFRQKIDCHL